MDQVQLFDYGCSFSDTATLAASQPHLPIRRAPRFLFVEPEYSLQMTNSDQYYRTIQRRLFLTFGLPSRCSALSRRRTEPP